MFYRHFLVKLPFILLAGLISWQESQAVTFVSEDVDCPMCDNTFVAKSCASYGSYVFDWESKYDLIYFPVADELWFWMCPKCGYAQNASDFKDISPEGVRRLRESYEEKWEPQDDGKIPFVVRLERAVQTNEILGRDDEFWRQFNRILIYHYRTISPEKALVYAENEIGLLKRAEPPDAETKKKTQYLLGEYHRMLGHYGEAKRNLVAGLDVRLQRNLTITWVLILVLVVVLGVLVWISMRRKFWIKVPITLILLGFSIWTWWPYSFLYVELDFRNNYYDEIIQDRLSLLSSQELPPSQS